MKLLTQVYTATVRPHMECASSAWSSAAKTNLDQLTKTQNAGLRIITGGMKTTPISELERTTGLLSLGERREEKLLRQSEKMKRLPSHPLHSKFEAPTKNRLKRQSPNHLVKALQQKHRISSSARNQPLEMLQNHEDWQAETPTIILDIPGIQAKDHHTDEELRSLTLEALSVAYPSNTWGRIHEGPSRYRDHKANRPDSYGPLTCSEEAVFTKAGQQGPQLSARVFLNHDLVTDCACVLKGMCTFSTR